MILKTVILIVVVTVCVNILALGVTSFVFVNIAAAAPDKSPKAATTEFLKGFRDCFDDAETLWTGDDYCTWTGITCDKQTQEVRIDLSNRNLHGALPSVSPEWGYYVLVTEVNLSDNRGLSGDFDPSWRYLVHMRSLDLSRTSLTGRIPAVWQEMHELETVNIYNTAACESIPRWLPSNLPRLQVANFSFNNFYGLLPDTWGKFKTLRAFDLTKNHFCGCPPGAWMPSAGSIIMTVALLDRSMVTADCKASTCLEYNKCPANPPESHSIPPSSGDDDSSAQSDRSEGDASSSSYHDEGSSSSSSQQSGEKEPEEPIDGNDVCTRKLLNEFMDAFPTLRSIWGISANYCEWPHIVCQRVGPKDHEVRIELSNQGLFGEMPEADDDWGHCSKVVYVDLSNNNVHGDVEEDWEDLTQLRYINLSHTDVDDKLPSDWKHLTNLETLDLSDTKVDHDLPSDWKYLGKLKFLNLSSTKVKGSLPSKWMTMYSLEELYINDAKLEKSLPNWYGSSMPKLRVVELRNNNFEGRLAESWSTLNLETLKIDGNKWCGCVPPSWANSPVLSEAAAFPGSTLLNPTCHTDKCKKA